MKMFTFNHGVLSPGISVSEKTNGKGQPTKFVNDGLKNIHLSKKFGPPIIDGKIHEAIPHFVEFGNNDDDVFKWYFIKQHDNGKKWAKKKFQACVLLNFPLNLPLNENTNNKIHYVCYENSSCFSSNLLVKSEDNYLWGIEGHDRNVFIGQGPVMIILKPGDRVEFNDNGSVYTLSCLQTHLQKSDEPIVSLALKNS